MLGGEQRVQVEARNDGKIFIMTVGRNIPNLRSKVWRSRVVETMHIYIWGYFLCYMMARQEVRRDSNTEGVLCRRGEYRVWRPDTASIHTRLCGGWVLPKPRLVGCGYAATQVGSLSRRGLGFKASLNPQFWHHTQSSSLPVVLSTRSYPTHA